MNNNPISCVICKKLVPLETARIDERGQPVHEECYALRISRELPRREEQKN
jgi:hypothetical protein